MNAKERLTSALADRYTIDNEVGAGGMATVFLAVDVKHGRQVAIKALRPELAVTLGSERFFREIEIAAKLSHPHILPLFDSGEAEGVLYYVMPFVEGESLRERLEREGKLPVAETVRLTEQIASALSYAHEQGVIHRDVKPENILLTGGSAVVADFGVARAVSAAGGEKLTRTGLAVGTPTYMSPEQAFGDTSIDNRSDVYALGCVVYEMASGRVPFEARTPQALLTKHAVDMPRSLRTIDPDIPLFVERAVSRAMAKEPEQRFKTANELAETLRSQTVLPRTGRRRLAVLPPTNLNNDPEQEYFVAGMHNALISELQKVGVPVIARTSVLQYQNTLKPAHEIAAELGVDALIESSVFRAERSVELEVRVVDGTSEEFLTDPISRGGELKNVMALFRELTSTVAAEIQVALTPLEKARLGRARTVNPEAYDAYLKGQFHFWRLTPADLELALDYFRRALELDPTYASAQAGIAWVWWGRGTFMIVTPDEATRKATMAYQRALALDSSLAEVQYAVALVRIWLEWDWEGGEAAFREALTINPNYADARMTYSSFLFGTGRPDEARAQMERALELDPFNPLTRSLNGARLLFERRYPESIKEFEAALRIEPDNPAVFLNLASPRFLTGNYDEGLAMLRKFFPGDEELAEAFDGGYAEGGYQAALLRGAGVLEVRPGARELMAPFIMYLYAWAGEREETLDWLEVMCETRNPVLLGTILAPELDFVFHEPRYRDLIRQMEFPIGIKGN